MTEISAQKASYHATITQEILDDSAGMPTMLELQQRWEAEQAVFDALPAEEQARITAERAAEREAARLERTCEHCGCDPEDHGGY